MSSYRPREYRRMRARRLAIAALVASASLIIPLIAYKAYTLVTSNYDVYFVVTGSMEPYVPRGSIVIIRKVTSPGEVALGDIVAYRLGDYKVLHRVVGFYGEGVVTKGDAATSSERVPWSSVEGVMVLGFPWARFYLAVAAVALAAAALAIIIAGGRGA